MTISRPKEVVRLDKESHRFLVLQRPAYANLSVDESERRLNIEIDRFGEIIKPWLPRKNVRRPVRVVDVGCGIGTSLVALWRHFRQGGRYVALDKTETARSIYYGFEAQAAAYNDLGLTTNFLLTAGIKPSLLTTIDVNQSSFPADLGPYDVVISTISWGFHYPVSTYLQDVVASTLPGAVLYLDLRLGTTGEDDLKPYFELLWSASGRKQFSGVWRRR